MKISNINNFGTTAHHILSTKYSLRNQIFLVNNFKSLRLDSDSSPRHSGWQVADFSGHGHGPVDSVRRRSRARSAAARLHPGRLGPGAAAGTGRARGAGPGVAGPLASRGNDPSHSMIMPRSPTWSLAHSIRWQLASEP